MMSHTLYDTLLPVAVNPKELEKKYKPVLGLVNELLGFLPNADPVLEIWPTAFRTYNLLIPNLMNLPQSLMGNKELKKMISLAMFFSSRSADCRYCTAHACTFVLRRGGSADLIKSKLSPKEKVVADVATAMATIPSTMTLELRQEMEKHFSEKDASWIVLTAALMGFLNKVMATLGVELETEAFLDVGNILEEIGWDAGIHENEGAVIPEEQPKIHADNLMTYLRIFRHAPGAIRLEKGWTKGVPANSNKIEAYLKEKTGHTFPLFKHLKAIRVQKTLATVMRDQLDPEISTLPLSTKYLTGIVYGTFVQNEAIKSDYLTLLEKSGKTPGADAIKQLEEFVLRPLPATLSELSQELALISQLINGYTSDAAALLLAKAAADSPTIIPAHIIEMANKHLSAPQIVEITSWLGVLQFFQRAGSYFLLK